MKKNQRFRDMLQRVLYITAAILLGAIAVSAMNGLAVSVTWRDGCAWAPLNAPEASLSGNPMRGALCKYTIQSNRTTGCDTLVRRSEGMAHYPAFSFDARRVAFYHWGAKITSNNQLSGQGDTNNYIAVINADGSGLTNLVKLRAMPNFDCALAWPIGEWIYYVEPQSNGAFYNQTQKEIHRVNATTRADEVVCTPNGGSSPPSNAYIRRFTLSFDATRTGLQIDGMSNSDGSYWNVNGAYCFPPPGGNLKSSGCSKGWCGSCNFSLSCSGDYGSGYMGGWHEEVFMNKLSGSGPNTPSSQPTLAKAQTYLGFSPGLGAECIRWAANSDKWMTECVGWYGHADNLMLGSNSLAINWVNNEYIMVTNNPKQAQNSSCNLNPIGSCTGDLWVGGGPANSYEGADGSWHSTGVPVQVGEDHMLLESNELIAPAMIGSHALVIAARGRVKVQIIDARGAVVAAVAGTGPQTIDVSSMSPGIYVIRVNASNTQTRTVRMPIGG